MADEEKLLRFPINRQILLFTTSGKYFCTITSVFKDFINAKIEGEFITSQQGAFVISSAELLGSMRIKKDNIVGFKFMDDDPDELDLVGQTLEDVVAEVRRSKFHVVRKLEKNIEDKGNSNNGN